MASRMRFLLRWARMLIACVVLGVVAAPTSIAAAGVDAVACVAGPSRSVPREDAPKRTTRESRHASRRALVAASAPGRSAVVRAPARARVTVVRTRLYLRHAALLR
jgi:hypothetical protein